MLKCKYADDYKAIRPPKCGCETCEDKWRHECCKRYVSSLQWQRTVEINAFEAKLSKLEGVLKRIANDANDGRAFTGITAERYREWCNEALEGD